MPTQTNYIDMYNPNPDAHFSDYIINYTEVERRHLLVYDERYYVTVYIQ